MIKRLIKEQPILCIILVLAFMVRCIAGYVQSFSNDELSALYRLQYDNFYDLMYWGVQVDNHPALTQLFLYFYEPLVPKGEIFIRLPFILTTTISLGYIFFSLKKLSGEFTAYLVTIVLAFAGFSIQLGYFARPYAFGILFTSAATYYWIRIFIENDKAKKYLFFFILFAILSAYTHYLALLQIAVLGAATFLFAPIRSWWKIVVAGVISLVAFLPHGVITTYHLSVGGIGAWLGKTHDYFIIDVLFEYFDRSAFVLGAFVLVGLIMIAMQPTKPKLKHILVLSFMSFTPFLILYFYSIKINPLLQYSACFFLMPYMLGAFFSIFETPVVDNKHVKYLYVLLITVFLSSTFFFYKAFAPIHFAEFKKIAQYIEEHESDSVTTIVAVNNPFFINYYLKDKRPDMYITDMGDNLSFLRRYMDTCKTKEFIYAWTNERSNMEVPLMGIDKFPVLYQRNYYLNSELYHFTNWRGNEYPMSYFSGARRFVYDRDSRSFIDMKEEKRNEPVSEFMLGENDEYSPTLEIKLSNYDLKVYDRIIATANIGENEFCDVELVISIEDGDKSAFWRSRKLSFQYAKLDSMETDNMVSLVPAEFIYLHPLTIAESFEDSHVDLKKQTLKVYLINPNHCNCRVEDFTIWILDGNPYTTGYSQ